MDATFPKCLSTHCSKKGCGSGAVRKGIRREASLGGTPKNCGGKTIWFQMKKRNICVGRPKSVSFIIARGGNDEHP